MSNQTKSPIIGCFGIIILFATMAIIILILIDLIIENLLKKG